MSFDYGSATPRELIDHICLDGIVSREEAIALGKRLNEDWVISKEEAELLFRINDGTQGEAIEEWRQLFVSAITQFVVFDLESPGTIDVLESGWLIDQLRDHAPIDSLEKELLANISKQASSIAPALQALIREAEMN